MRAKISEGGTIKLLIECCAVARLQKQETTLFKIKDSGSKPRYYRINPAGTRIYWKSRSKKARNANIRVGDIKELRSVFVDQLCISCFLFFFLFKLLLLLFLK